MEKRGSPNYPEDINYKNYGILNTPHVTNYLTQGDTNGHSKKTGNFSQISGMTCISRIFSRSHPRPEYPCFAKI